jgi:CheY-like chemotaxis protein
VDHAGNGQKIAGTAGVVSLDRRARPRPQRVLVVDDSPDIRELWVEWLKFWGFAVDQACDGFQAVEQARACHPDLVLMDLWMPGLDGFAATERLKADEEMAAVPVLALSADSSAATPARALAAGCDAFLPKPVSSDHLLEEIRLAFRRATSRRRRARRSCRSRGR